MKDDQKLIIEHADQLLQVLNQERHDWLNHFQVIHSYIKLGRYQDGEHYLGRIIQESQQDSMIARMNCSKLSAYLMTFNAMHKDVALEVEMRNQVDAGQLAITHAGFYDVISKSIELLRSHLLSEQDEHPNLLVTLFQSEDHIIANFDLEGQVSASVAGEVEKLIHDLNGMAKLTSEQLHTNSSWNAEISFPCKM
ncbi:Spo0B domain-containing protein [Brevibacillus daliensis]|uniref:Spo0B domain-containing protein n=1 Tax=Brevibacillus daliensis TaxID=2892995 RepID=UPI001E3665FE|nr:Spo0B domain-containing protein [Brevibacillus daliensis]